MARLHGEDATKHRFAGLRIEQRQFWIETIPSAAKRCFVASSPCSRAIYGMIFRPDAAVQKHEPMLHFVLCIRKAEDDDLELRKAYAVLPPAANETGYLCVIDGSGGDYLYPADCFIPLELPQNVERMLLAV